MLDDAQPFGDRRHHSVLDAVVDHLHEMARPVRSAVQVTIRRGAVGARPVRRRLRASLARGDRLEQRVEPSDDLGLPADHQAVTAIESPHTAARSAVEVVDLPLCQRLGPDDVVAVVGVPAVYHRVVGVEQLDQLIEHGLDDPGRHHDPERPGLLELAHKVLERGGPGRSFTFQFLHHRRVDVIDDAAMPILHEAADEIGPHPAQADHAELQWCGGWHRSPPRCS